MEEAAAAVVADLEVEEEAVEALEVVEGEVVVVLGAVGVEVEVLVVAVLEGEEEGVDSDIPIMIIIIMIMLGNLSIIFLHEVILITLFLTFFFVFLAI